jgi:di/tricarboxylate transporter
MKTHTKLRLGGIALLVIPALILSGVIAYQLSQMNPPSWGQLKLRWAFIAFYAMAAGIVLLVFARGTKEQYIKNKEMQKRHEESNRKI